MFKLLLTILALLILSGCESSKMTGTEMRTAINECEDNNLTFKVFTNSGNGPIFDIQCAPIPY